MPVFRYSGFTVDGTNISGVIEASGVSDAAAKIKAEGILPAEIQEPLPRRSRGVFQRIDETFLPNMTRQLSILLVSGVPLIDALQSLSDEHKGFYRDILISVKEHVSGGMSLYRAMEDFSDIFPEFYVQMVQAGEQSGRLDRVLVKLADFLENQNTVRAKVRASMIYPIIMMGVGFVVLSFLFTFVIPKILTLFEHAQSALPFVTVVLIFISTIFIDYWWVLVIVAASLFLGLKKLARSRRIVIDRMLLRLPGDILQSLYYARFSRTLGFLIEGGIPVLRALSLSSKSMGNKVLEMMVIQAETRVAGGQRLSASLERLSPVLIQLIATGEKSGRLAETLNRAADSYEEEFNRKIHKAVSLFEPLMILFMGLVVGFIVLAVLLPMFQLNQLIK